VAGETPANDDLQAQIDTLLHQVRANRADIDALRLRADASDDRADATDVRAAVSEVRADAAEERTDAIETQALVDRDMIADLQRDGVLSRDHATQMEEALRSSRTIGAAIGIIMASRHLTEDQAFEVLKAASSSSHRKLRDLASDLVRSAAG
jgi:hypothetical protein